MNRMIKYAAAAGTAGLLALGMAAPSYAAHGRNAAAAVGFGVGAAVGAAAANANPNGDYNGYYGPGYGYQAEGYGYHHGYQAPDYAYDSQPGYGAYAYAPGGPGNDAMPSCAIQGTYGKPVDMADCY